MWDLFLKSLLQRTRWCNRILIKILGFGDISFFYLKKYKVRADVSNFGFTCMLLLAWLRDAENKGPKQLNSAHLFTANYFTGVGGMPQTPMVGS